MSQEEILLAACVNFISQLEDCVDEPELLRVPSLTHADAEAMVVGETVRIEMRIPAGAVYSDFPPKFPQAGTYCFPSGNFKASADLGWPLKLNASRSFKQKRRVVDDNNRLLYLKCRQCEAGMKAVVGPFLTTLHVFELPEGAKHRHE